jgi:seryl-tRNA synthetase
MGFNQKLEHLDKQRQECVGAMEELDDKYTEFEEMKQAREEAERRATQAEAEVEELRKQLEQQQPPLPLSPSPSQPVGASIVSN